MQVRVHQGWLHHLLHLRRQGLLPDDSILLRVPLHLLRAGLLLLYLLQQHARLLRHLLVGLHGNWRLRVTRQPGAPPTSLGLFFARPAVIRTVSGSQALLGNLLFAKLCFASWKAERSEAAVPSRAW